MQKSGGAAILMKSISEAFEATDLMAGTRELNDKPLTPYSDEAIDFLSDLSSTLIKEPNIRALSDVVSFAFWCRRSHLVELKNQFIEKEGPLRYGRGIAFHIAPSNVPVNFAFSYAFSLLAGNVNIVRVPSKDFAQVRVICDTIDKVLVRHQRILKRSAFIKYPAVDEVTEAFSAYADARLIWGGDKTIAHIRSLPCKPRSVDAVFSDRYSLAVIGGKAVAELSNEGMRILAEKFYNDTYLMDQNACSSPQLVLWLGADESNKRRFWAAVADYASTKYELQAAVSIEKYVRVSSDACAGRVEHIFRDSHSYLYLVSLDDDVSVLEDCRGVGGYFYERDIVSFDDVVPFVNEKYQTVSYYGVAAREIADALLRGCSKGIDRIVPIGKAMDIDIVWDGYDLVDVLSRTIDMR